LGLGVAGILLAARGVKATYVWLRYASTVFTSPSASGIRACQPFPQQAHQRRPPAWSRCGL